MIKNHKRLKNVSSFKADPVRSFQWRCYYCLKIVTGDRLGHNHKFNCVKGHNIIVHDAATAAVVL